MEPIVPADSIYCFGSTPFILISADFVRTGGMDLANFHMAMFLARTQRQIHLVAHEVDPTLLGYHNVVWHKVPRPLRSNLLGEFVLRSSGRRLAGRKELARSIVVVNGGNCPLAAVNWVHYVHAASPRIGSSGLLQRSKNLISHFLFRRDEARAFGKARVLIANSERTRNDLIRFFNLDPLQVHCVYYGADPDHFYPVVESEKQYLREKLGFPAGKFLFAFVGALGDRRKGFDTLFEAWKSCGEAFGKAAGLVVVGRGAELPDWKRRAAQAEHCGYMSFLGFRHDVPDILRACDGFVAPTRYEAFGLGVLEALCCGLPAIVSRDAGVAEKYPPELKSLLLNDPEDTAELTDKLLTVWSHAESLKASMNGISSELRAYTWNNMAGRVCRLALESATRPGQR